MQKTITIPAGNRMKFSQVLVDEAFITDKRILLIKVDGQFGRQLSGTDSFGNLFEFKNSEMVEVPPFHVQPELQALKSLFAKES